MERQVDYTPFIEWINKQDVFWTQNMLAELGIKRTEKIGKEENAVGHLLRTARHYGHIQCCGRDGSHYQYITISKIPLDIKLR